MSKSLLNPWMTRTIAITPWPGDEHGNQITVPVNYNYQGQTEQVVLVSYISSYS